MSAQNVPSSPSPAEPKRPSRVRAWGQWRWMMGVGIALLLLSVLGEGWMADVAGRLLLPLLVLATLVQWRIRQMREGTGESKRSVWIRIALKMWRPKGSGFYALIAALTFLNLQVSLLAERTGAMWGTWRDAPYFRAEFFNFLGGQLWGLVQELVIRVSIGTVLNAVWAGLWPLTWVDRFGLVASGALAVLAYVTYRGARRMLPAFDAVMQTVDQEDEPGEVPPSRHASNDASRSDTS